jgi:DNA-binding LytR/AlgR family response regulator
MLVGATAAAAAASLLLAPWYDMKAMSAILAGGLALAAASAIGLRDGKPLALIGLASAFGQIGLMVWQRTLFLDQGYYFFLAALLVALIAEQLSSLRRARTERDRETRRAAALADRLARAEREGEPIVALKDGSRTHRVAESDILFVRAADDYCDVALHGGRTLLVTSNLARLLAILPERFVRVHKSYAVNRAHVMSVGARPGGGRELRLSNGSVVPVGRRYSPAVTAWAEGRCSPLHRVDGGPQTL